MSRQLRAGDRVRVRSAEQILATLDARGRLEGLPFMPEMLEYCGREFTVYHRADKVCYHNTEGEVYFRRMRHTVHLGGVRCTGSAHDGCQAACLMHWKEAWLDPVDPAVRQSPAVAPGPGSAPDATLETLHNATREAADEDGAIRYSCQATTIPGASEPMTKSKIANYLREVRSRNATIPEVMSALSRGVISHYQRWSRRTLPGWMLVAEGRTPDELAGVLTKTPRGQLHLRPGDQVRVKSRDEIAATLDSRGRNRGLSFFGQMIDDCGSETQVLARVSRLIDERSGRMLELTNDCLILDGKICKLGLCPRADYTLWREVWLTRAEESK